LQSILGEGKRRALGPQLSLDVGPTYKLGTKLWRNEDFSVNKFQLLSSIQNIINIYDKYKTNIDKELYKYCISEMITCNKLILAENYSGLLDRLNSDAWWGEGSISDCCVFSNIIKESECSDAKRLQGNLLFLANLLSENNIDNKTAKEFIFQAESWPF
jgi:hypothetical protein